MSASPVRPEPEEVRSAAEVTGWYWTRAQLDAIARRCGVARTGDKAALTARLVAHFDGAAAPPPARRRRETPLRPPFTDDMVVPAGQPMTRALREYLRSRTGPGFRYDGHMREFFADPQGRSLVDAVRHWHDTRGVPRPIGAQFRFNRFTREYRHEHPGASHAQVLTAWEEHKQRPI